MFTMKFLFLSIKIWVRPQNMYATIKYTQKQRFDIYFHSQPCILLITSHFDVLFIIITPDERQNVVVKSDILTMLKDLKPRTKVISNRDTLITIYFAIFRMSRHFSRWLSKKNNISCLMWVCLKVSKTMLFRSI